MQSIICFQQSAHTILCRMKNFWNLLLLTDVAELLPNHIQIPIEINNLCYTSKIKLSAKVGMYLWFASEYAHFNYSENQCEFSLLFCPCPHNV